MGATEVVGAPLLADVQEAARLSGGPEAPAAAAVSPVELALCESAPPPPAGDRLSAGWIQQAAATLTELQRRCDESLSERQSELYVSWDEVRAHVIDVRDLLTSHHKLVSDVRLLLKAIAKASGAALPAVAAYMAQYRQFCERLSALVRRVLSDPVSRENVSRQHQLLTEVQADTESIYDTLLTLAAQLSTEEGRPAPRERTKDSPDSGEQGCNQYALAVWRRVRQKLEGCDPDPTRAASVAEQVEFTIQEATSRTNLALLYEGWTAWV